MNHYPKKVLNGATPAAPPPPEPVQATCVRCQSADFSTGLACLCIPCGTAIQAQLQALQAECAWRSAEMAAQAAQLARLRPPTAAVETGTNGTRS